MAAGSGADLSMLGALNARTEVLAGHECTTVACLGDVTRDGGPLGAQTWDWHRELAPAVIVWTIDHPDGRRVQTLTEAGIVGKIGVSDAGVAVLLNILGHRDDGPPIGTPVHALARHVLDRATGAVEALQILAAASVSASSSVTIVADDADGGVVCSVELWPGGPSFVTPNAEGRLVHTNHFLTHPAADGDTMVRQGPDSVLRHDLAGRRLARLEAGAIDGAALREVLTSHRGGPGAICAHPPEGAVLGEALADAGHDHRRPRAPNARRPPGRALRSGGEHGPGREAVGLAPGQRRQLNPDRHPQRVDPAGDADRRPAGDVEDLGQPAHRAWSRRPSRFRRRRRAGCRWWAA